MCGLSRSRKRRARYWMSGPGRQVTIREVVERLAQLTGSDVRPLFGALPTGPSRGLPWPMSNGQERRFGRRATTDLDRGLRRTLDWLRY